MRSRRIRMPDDVYCASGVVRNTRATKLSRDSALHAALRQSTSDGMRSQRSICISGREKSELVWSSGTTCLVDWEPGVTQRKLHPLCRCENAEKYAIERCL